MEVVGVVSGALYYLIDHLLFAVRPLQFATMWIDVHYCLYVSERSIFHYYYLILSNLLKTIPASEHPIRLLQWAKYPFFFHQKPICLLGSTPVWRNRVTFFSGSFLHIRLPTLLLIILSEYVLLSRRYLPVYVVHRRRLLRKTAKK